MHTKPHLTNSLALFAPNAVAFPPLPWLMRIAGNGPFPSGFRNTPSIETVSSLYVQLVPSSLKPGSGSAARPTPAANTSAATIAARHQEVDIDIAVPRKWKGV